MAFNAGNAFITVSPDMSKFQSAIKAQMKEQGDAAGKTFADSFQARLKTAFADLPNAKVTADADTAKAKADLDALTKTRTAKVKVSIDKSALKKLALPALAVGGASALGPSALGLAAGVAGLGVAAGSALGTLGAFAAVAKGPVTDALKANEDAAKGDLTALQALSPAERQLATELGGVTSAWQSLQKAETPVVASALAPWLQTATSGMQLLDPVIQDAAGAIQLLGTEAQKALAAPFWGTFFNTVGSSGQIALVNFGEAAGKVADGLAHLFVTFAPDIDKLPPLVNKAADAFDKWAKSVTAGGLEDFFAKVFSPSNVAMLKQDLGNLATIVQNIATAGAQLSPTAFAGLSNLLTVLAKLSPGQIEALGILYGVAKTVGGAGNLAKLASGGAGISLPKIGKKAAAKTGTSAAEKAAEKAAPGAGLLGGAALPAAAGAAVGLAGHAAGSKVAPPGSVPGAAASAATSANLPGGFAFGGLGAAALDKVSQMWSPAYESFQRDFAGPMTAWFTQSLPNFFVNAIPQNVWSPAYEGFQSYFAGPLTGFFTNVLPGFFTNVIPANVWSPAYEGFEQYIGSPVANFFTSQLPGFFTTGVPGAWSWAYEGFEQNVGSPVAAWFTDSVPHFFTSAVPAAWDWAYQGFSTAVGTPVANWFSQSVPHFFTSAVPAAWSWAWTGFTSAVGTPVSNWFASSVPHFFTSAVPSAWSWAWSAFSSGVGSKVSGWFTSSLPSFVTRSIPGAFSSLWSSFSSAVVSPVTNFFTSTLPSLASSAASTAKSTIGSILGSAASALGFASGTKSAPPGWAWVGEHGPELMHFNGGEQVLNHTASLAKAQSMASLGAVNVPSVSTAPRLPGVGTPASGGQLQMQVTYVTPAGDAIAGLVQGFQFHIQGVNGGDVQGALGQGPVRVIS